MPDDLAAGDIVELFDSNLWKWVEVVRVGDRHLDVKFVGSAKVFTADRRALRPRLLYGQDGWVVVHKNGKIPLRSAVPSRPIAGKNIKSKAIGNGNGNGGSNFAAHAVKLGKTKRTDYTVHADIVRDVKRFQGNSDTNRRLFVAKGEEPAARYNDNKEVMDVHPRHYYLEKRQETGNNLDRSLAPRTDSDKDDDDVSSKQSHKSSSSGDSSSTSSGSSNGSNSKGGDRIVSSGNGATLEHCQENQEAEIQPLPSFKEEEQDSGNRTEPRARARMHDYRANEVQVVVKQDEEEEQHDRRVQCLELEAYVSVMKAFYATGLLTWSKVELLSDLRVQLHISNDDHLDIIWGLKGKKRPRYGRS
uniref:Uncharacterized protein n=1 Tax=Avena sativa TaxID=4498 RepID=A0ACD6AR20_AVESA